MQEIPQDHKGILQYCHLKVPSFDFTLSSSITLGFLCLVWDGAGVYILPFGKPGIPVPFIDSFSSSSLNLQGHFSSVVYQMSGSLPCPIGLCVYLWMKPYGFNYQSFVMLLTVKQFPPRHSSSKLFWPFWAQIEF